jgi:peroxiredoxin
MAGKKKTFILDGKTYKLSERKINFIQRLREVAKAIAENEADAAVVLSASDEFSRGSYVCESNADLDRMLDWHLEFGKYLKSEVATRTGTAPPSNRSTLLH